MIRAVTWLVLAGSSLTSAQPALPVLDWGACPYETCMYREWTVHKPITIFDTWKADRHEVAKLASGEKVIGVTGVVITNRPGIVRMDRDLPEQKLKRGDNILTYADRGEGYSAVWVHGKFHHDFDISFTKLPDGTGCGNGHCAATYLDLGDKKWWAQVKLKSGVTGWVYMDTTVAGDIPF